MSLQYTIPARTADFPKRQAEIIELVHMGYTNPQIAKVMGIQTGTVKNVMRLIFERLQIASRVELALWYERTTKPKPEEVLP